MGMKEIALKEYFEALLSAKEQRDQQRFEAQSQAIKEAFAAAKEAVSKAEVATEKRFEGVNEFRAALSDQNNRQVSLVQFEALRDTVGERINNILGRLDRTEGRTTGVKDSWGVVVGIAVVVGALAGVLSHFILR